MTSTKDLINPQGRLIELALEVDLSTVQHAYEIQNDRRKDESFDLMHMLFWTADFPLYKMEKGEVVLYMATRENNLLFKNLRQAVRQLREKNNYFPKDEDIGSVINADSTLRVKYSDLNPKPSGFDEWSGFRINIPNLDKSTQSQRLMLERVCGKGQDFTENMEMFKEHRFTELGISVLNPDYVKKTLKENNVTSIARGSFLNCFAYNSDFIAGWRFVEHENICLRGLPKSAAGAK